MELNVYFKRVIKILLNICNIILLIYGIFLTICGIMIINDLRIFGHFLESKIFWLPYFITFNGIMMIILSIIGIYALFKRNYKLLVTLCISAFVVLLVEIAVITYVAAEQPAYADALRISLKRSLNSGIAVDRKSWNILQRKLQCCGIDGPQDWNTVFGKKNQVPASCCTIAPDDQPGVFCRNSPESGIVYQFGCHQILLKRLLDHWSVISLLAILTAFIQLAALILSIIMAFLLRQEKKARERQ